jgi:RNA polymerase sigma-70 factor (sigma-E family)
MLMSARITNRAIPNRTDMAAADDDLRQLRYLFEERYSAMIGLARLLLGDLESAEDVVQEAFAGLSGRLHGVENPEAYLSTMVVNQCRAAMRRRQTIRRHAWRFVGRTTLSDPGQGLADRQAVLSGLRRLPARQRECLVLRYYLDWSEQQIADALGISTGSVKTHTSRALVGMNELLKDLP